MENTLENIGLKNVSIDFLNSEIKNLFVVQGDTRTRGLLVRVKDNKGNTIPLSDEYELRLYAKRSGEDKLLYSVAEKIGDRYKVYLTSDMLAKTGTLKIQLALYKGDVSLIQSRQSSIPIYPSMTCQFELGQDNVIDIVEIQETIKNLEKEFEKLKSFDGIDSLADFKKSEEERQQAEEQRKQSEEQRVVEETTRSLNEKSRVENEKQRIANEETRQANEEKRLEKDTLNDEKEQSRNSNEEARKLEEQKRIENENSRVSQEKERQEHENTREENEKIRKISETVRDDNETKRKLEEDTRVQQELKRVEDEKTRTSSEQARVNEEQTRQSNEEERKKNELERIKAEQQRSAKDTERDVTFKSWDAKIKALSGLPEEMPDIPVLEKATETTAGIVKLKGLTEQDDTAVSYSLYNKDITEKEQAINAKIEEQGAKLLEQDKTIQGQDTKINGINEKLSTTDTDIKDLKDTTQSLSTKTDELSKNIESKASKEDIDTLTTQISTKASQDDINKLSTELTEKVNSFSVAPATSEKAGTVKIDVDGESTVVSKKTYLELIDSFIQMDNTVRGKLGVYEFENLFRFKADKSDLDKKSDIGHTHLIADITNLQTTLDKKLEATDISELDTKVNANAKSISDISTTLDNKADKTDIVSKTDLRSKADKVDLDKKANVSHTHNISDITNLQSNINSIKANSSSISQLTNVLDKKANIEHIHNISDISDLQYTLNNKASASDLSSLEAKVNNLSTDKISNKNRNGSLSFWTGTQNEYDRISPKDSNTIYFITE